MSSSLAFDDRSASHVPLHAAIFALEAAVLQGCGHVNPWTSPVMLMELDVLSLGRPFSAVERLGVDVTALKKPDAPKFEHFVRGSEP